MEPLRTYSLNNVVLIVGDRDIAAGGGDGAIEEEPAADRFTPKMNINGLATISTNHDESTVFTITVDSHSRAARDLDEILEEQRDEAAQGGIQPREFLLRDPSNGDETRSRFCVILNKPGMGRGATTGDVQTRIWVPDGQARGKSPRGAATT